MSVVAEKPGTTAGTAEAPSSEMHRVRRHGVVYAAGLLLSRGIGFLMLPVYTRYLTPADYGTLQLIELTFEVVMIVAGVRLSAGIFHFYHKANGERERRAMLTTTLLLMVLSYGAATMAALFAAPAISELVFRTPANAELVRLGAMSLGLSSFSMVPLAYLQVRERSHRYVLATSVKVLLQLGLNLVTLVGLGMGAKGILLGTVIANAIVGAWLSFAMLKEVGLTVSGLAARAVLRFTLPLIAMQIATFVYTYGDRFFLQRAFPKASDGDAAVGLYGLAYQFGFLLSSVGFYPFHQIWDPIRFEIAKRPDRDRIYARAFVYFNIVYLTIAVMLGLMVYDFLRVMATPAFVAAAAIAPVVMLAYVLQGWTEFQNLGLLITERTALLSFATWTAGAVALIGYILLIPRYHGMGAALATVAAFAVRQALVLIMSQRYWPVKYHWPPVLKLISLAIGVVFVGMQLDALSIPASIAARLGLFGVYVLGVWSLGILTPDDRAAIRALLRAPRHAVAGLRRMLLGSSV